MAREGGSTDLRLARFHGTLTPGYRRGQKKSRSKEEEAMRNNFFLAGRISLVESRRQKTLLRVIGYEMPLSLGGAPRRHCLDLLAYDQRRRPYLIELKCSRAKDRPREAIDQIEEYAELFERGKVRTQAQLQIARGLFWPEFRLKGAAAKVVIAPSRFFRQSPEDWCGVLSKDVGIYHLRGDPEKILNHAGGIVNVNRVTKRWLNRRRSAPGRETDDLRPAGRQRRSGYSGDTMLIS